MHAGVQVLVRVVSVEGSIHGLVMVPGDLLGRSDNKDTRSVQSCKGSHNLNYVACLLEDGYSAVTRDLSVADRKPEI